MLATAALLLLLLPAMAGGFYVPVKAPVDFRPKDQVEVQVDKLTSVKTQLPFDYYYLPFCRPDAKEMEQELENIGEILAGDRIRGSKYVLDFKQPEQCQVVCSMSYSAADMNLFASFIQDDYQVNWILDNLPAAVRYFDELKQGFPLGYVGNDGVPYIFNHISFNVEYNDNEGGPGTSRIVGFEVTPYSVKHTKEGDTTHLQCSDAQPVTREMEPMPVDKPGTVVFTYDVTWEKSNTPWDERWEKYLQTLTDVEVHWVAVINSTVILLVLTGMIAVILLRSLRRDIMRYNEETSIEDLQEETGWKLVHGDVFRPPLGRFGPMVLSVFVGSGCQILMMGITLMIIAGFGVLSPANRGGFVTALLALYVIMGFPAGFVSALLYKMFGGRMWKRNTLLTAFAFPGMVCSVFFVLNFFVWHTGSSSAIPFPTMLLIAALWFGISTPLVFLGAYFGYRKQRLSTPVAVNAIPREVRTQPWYLHPLISVLVGGMLPFGAVFIELFYILSNIWMSEVYYLFGFMVVSFFLLVITCGEIAILMCYFQLCAEDYNWWWRSFLTPASSAFYLFLYSILFYSTQMNVDTFVATLLYFSNMFLASAGFFLFTGAIGFLSALWFNRKIYSSIKIDQV